MEGGGGVGWKMGCSQAHLSTVTVIEAKAPRVRFFGFVTSTLAVYVPGWTPDKSHVTFEPSPVILPPVVEYVYNSCPLPKPFASDVSSTVDPVSVHPSDGISLGGQSAASTTRLIETFNNTCGCLELFCLVEDLESQLDWLRTNPNTISKRGR
jgi:hypothetical protein